METGSQDELAALVLAYQQSGNDADFEPILLKIRSKLMQRVVQLTGRQDEDLLMAAMLKICKSVARFKFKSSFLTWARRIVTWVIYDDWKEKEKDPLWGSADDVEQLEAPVESSEDDQPEISKAEQIDLGGELFQALGTYCKILLVLRLQDELSYREIAAELGPRLRRHRRQKYERVSEEKLTKRVSMSVYYCRNKARRVHAAWRVRRAKQADNTGHE